MDTLVHMAERLNALTVRVTQWKTHLYHVGEYKWSSRVEDFEGWLVCDGRSLDREIFPDLFSIIGTTFGSSDSNTFNLPDTRGRIMAAVGTSSNQYFGSVVGAEWMTLTSSNMPVHSHSGTVDSAGTHNHTASATTDGAHVHSLSTDGNHTHTTNANGGNVGLAVADVTNTVVDTDSTANELNVWTNPAALTINSAGAHTHTMGSSGSHTHTITIGNDGAHTHTFTTSLVGGGQAFSIMQPTLFGANLFIYTGIETSALNIV